jgi:hypothetical protein
MRFDVLQNEIPGPRPERFQTLFFIYFDLKRTGLKFIWHFADEYLGSIKKLAGA